MYILYIICIIYIYLYIYIPEASAYMSCKDKKSLFDKILYAFSIISYSFYSIYI